MQGENYQRITIVSFLIIGTLLTLYLTINVGYDLFCAHNVWMFRDGLMQKVGFVALFVNLPLLFIAGLTSTISFFRKGHIWKPITKGIIINIILWLILAGVMFCIFPVDLVVKICGLLIIGSFAWLISQIWKMVKLHS